MVPTALTADRCEYSRCLRSQRGSLQHKRGVWVWVWGRFSRATSWSQLAAPTLHTPLGALSPCRTSRTLGACPGYSLKLPAANCGCGRGRRRRRKDWGLNSVRASPHCSFSRNPSSEEAAAHHLSAPAVDWFQPRYAAQRSQSENTNNRWILSGNGAQPSSLSVSPSPQRTGT